MRQIFINNYDSNDTALPFFVNSAIYFTTKLNYDRTVIYDHISELLEINFHVVINLKLLQPLLSYLHKTTSFVRSFG